ncbi:MAG: hypothetical protein LBT46_06040 [Planctomycetaceae bacterium]|jgi:hypothetical protein|nr:hypothetical protein [Planctomycetaceae bacterium]
MHDNYPVNNKERDMGQLERIAVNPKTMNETPQEVDLVIGKPCRIVSALQIPELS